jgi:hypothetical protein
VNTPLRCSTLGYPLGLTRKKYTILKRPARDKNSNLLREFVTFRRKKFYKIEARTKQLQYWSCMMIRQYNL